MLRKLAEGRQLSTDEKVAGARVRDGVAELIVGFTRGEIEELEINPLIVCSEGKGAWIAGALLVLGDTKHG